MSNMSNKSKMSNFDERKKEYRTNKSNFDEKEKVIGT